MCDPKYKNKKVENSKSISKRMSSVYERELSVLSLSDYQKSEVCKLLSIIEKSVVKGRPLKSKKVVEVGGDADVFEQLLSMSDRQYESEIKELDKEIKELDADSSKIIAAAEKLEKETEKLSSANAKFAAKDAAKAAKDAAKAAKDATKAAKEAEKEAAVKAKEDAKQAKESAKAEKAAEKEAAVKSKEDAKAEKESEKESAKAEKEAAKQAKESAKAEKEAAKAEKEAAKLVKEAAKLVKEAAKAEKEAAKAEKEAAKAEKKAEPNNADEGSNGTGEALPVAPIIAPLAALNQGSPVAEEGSKGNQGSPAVRVKKFSFGGVKYLKDPAGTIYDLASQDRIGVWNEEDKKIVFDAKGDEEDECSEEDYEDADE